MQAAVRAHAPPNEPGQRPLWDNGTVRTNKKLLPRTEGDVVKGKADVTTGAEALWLRPVTAFWSTVLGQHQEFGQPPRVSPGRTFAPPLPP